MAGTVEFFPVLALFNALDIFVHISRFFKQTLLVKIVPVLAIFKGQGCWISRCLATATGNGEVSLVVGFSCIEVYLLSADIA